MGSDAGDILFVRATLHNSTNAIPRAREAAADVFRSASAICWDRLGTGLPRREVVDGLEVERYQGTARPQSPAMVLLIIRYQFWVFREVMRRKPAVVQALDFASAFPAAVACLLRGARLIYDVRDPLALSYSFGQVATAFIYLLDSFVMWACSGFIVPSQECAPYLGKWPSAKRPLVVVKNTCHDELETVEAEGGTRAQDAPAASGAGGCRTVSVAYLGHLMATRGAAWLVDFAKGNEGFDLVAAGKCRSPELLAALKKTPEVRWLGLVPNREALMVMHAASAVALLYDPAVPVNKIAGPNKYYESLMLGTPVLLSRGIGLAEEVERNGLGFVIEYGNSEELGRAVEVMRDPEQMRQMRARCRDFFLAHCRIEGEVERYRQFYKELLQRQEGRRRAPVPAAASAGPEGGAGPEGAGGTEVTRA